jgi:hypothetical protein
MIFMADLINTLALIGFRCQEILQPCKNDRFGGLSGVIVVFYGINFLCIS